ncbi:MAG: hypothetical protein IPF45_10335 [Thermomonas sp.]|nr:hypothetical protein [Thermomonas sp.]
MAALPAAHEPTSARTLAEAALPRRVRQCGWNTHAEIRGDMGRQLQTVLLETEVALTRHNSPVADPKVEAAKFVPLNNLRLGQQRFTTEFLADIETEPGRPACAAPQSACRLEEQRNPGPGPDPARRRGDETARSSTTSPARIESHNSLATLQLMEPALPACSPARRPSTPNTCRSARSRCPRHLLDASNGLMSRRTPAHCSGSSRRC